MLFKPISPNVSGSDIVVEVTSFFEAGSRVLNSGQERELDLFVNVAWAIWANRKKGVHGSAPSLPVVVISFISSHLDTKSCRQAGVYVTKAGNRLFGGKGGRGNGFIDGFQVCCRLHHYPDIVSIG